MSTEIADEIGQLRSYNAELRADVDALKVFLDTLQGLLDALHPTPQDEEVMAALASSLEGAVSVLGAAHGALLVLDEDSDELVTVLGIGAGPDAAWSRSHASAGLAGWVLQHQEAVIANDAPADERFDAEADQPPNLDTTSLLAVPMLGKGKAMGVLRIANEGTQDLFDEDDQVLISLLARFAGELLLRMALRHAHDDMDS